MRNVFFLLVIGIIFFSIPVWAESLLTGDTYKIGDNVTISGITNLNTDNTILVEIYPASFGPVSKYNISMTGGGSTTVPVSRNENGTYYWNTTMNTTGWNPDIYMVRVEALGKEYRETGYINLTEDSE